MQQHANCYESATNPLHYTDNTLVQRGDVVLYLHEDLGRVTKAQIMRVWDTIYYEDGEPIGVVLIDAESPKNSLPELYTFTVCHNVFGETKSYFRGNITVPEHKIASQLCPLFRMGIYMKKWDEEHKLISVVPQLPHEPYPDPEEIYEDFFRKAVLKEAKKRNPYCLFTAGLWQRENFYPHRALEFFRAAAQFNFAAAWLELGFAYDGSDLLERNPQKAAACFQQAALLKNALAYYELALCYIDGRGIEQSDANALDYLKKAIDNEILPAFLALALYYTHGTFNFLRRKNSPYRVIKLVKPKYREAFKLLKQAAQIPWEKQPVCQFYLAECYRLGHGVRLDPNEATRLYKEAIKYGDIMLPEIQEACYYTGNVSRLMAAIEADSPYASYLAGRMYLYGERNVEKNQIKGKGFLKLAAESAHECAEMAARMLQQKDETSWTFNQL